ncbi:MAG TPA: glycosyltransferase family 4 protein [Actinomycetota bacterium]|nr:glycosyltransferase family 4 protein [Actinomycetota bacterium]
MRIVLACPYAWDAPGGVQVHVGQLAEHLQNRGQEVLVLAPAKRRASGQPWVRLVGRAVRVQYQGTVAPICFSVRSARLIGSELRSFAPDLIHAHEPFSPSTAMLATLRARSPVVATFHAFTERSALYSVAAPFLRPVWAKLRVRIAVSQAAATFVGARFRDGVRVIPNACDVELFARGRPREGFPPGRRMLWVGRLDEQKGFPVAVRAFASLAVEFPDLTFVVVGEGRDRTAVSTLDPETRPRVLQAGSVPHADLPGYIAGADVFVAPALGQESFGIVLVEAMAAGVPVVASDIPGYREVVRDDLDGILVPPGDPDAVAGAVRRVLSGPTLAARLAEAGRSRAERYRWDVVIEEIEAAYKEALEERAVR